MRLTNIETKSPASSDAQGLPKPGTYIQELENQTKPAQYKGYQVYYHYGAQAMLEGAIENKGRLSPDTMRILSIGSTLDGNISIASNPISSAEYACKHGAKNQATLVLFFVRKGATRIKPLTGNPTWGCIDPKKIDGENIIAGAMTSELFDTIFTKKEQEAIQQYFSSCASVKSPRGYASQAFKHSLSSPQSSPRLKSSAADSNATNIKYFFHHSGSGGAGATDSLLSSKPVLRRHHSC